MKSLNKFLCRFVLSTGITMLCLAFVPRNLVVNAAESATDLQGAVYTSSEKDGGYEIDQNHITSDKALPKVTLSGSVKKKDKNSTGVDVYDFTGSLDEVNNSERLELTINYDSVLNDRDAGWELYEDSQKKIAGIDVSRKVKNGALVIQSSFTGQDWNTDYVRANALTDSSAEKEPVYRINANQLSNGCYVRAIFAYSERKANGKKLVKTQYIYRKTTTVFEFYISSPDAVKVTTKPSDTPLYEFNSNNNLLVNAGNDDGYSKTDPITAKDIHYNWSMGKFVINGFSGNPVNKDGKLVFLKNVGDRVTLWFHLDQPDLNKLNGQEGLKVQADDNGSDQYFKTPVQNFKRGALVIKYTNFQNHSTTNVYTDYLAAAATTKADTKVQLFEEGDYEVALDYQIFNQEKLVGPVKKPAKTESYRIYFKFSVRNSNCMVYPIDLGTGSELIPSTYTENGFKLDHAKSRYLDTQIKREVLNGDQLDVRESQVSSDLEEYTDEGVYTFTVHNRYTDDDVTKIIYVGTDNLLKAYAINDGKKSISDLKQMEKDGYTFSDDGKIIEPETKDETEESSENSSVEMIAVENGKTNDASVAETTAASSNQKAKSTKQSDETSKQTADTKGTENTTKKPDAMPIVIAVVLIIAAAGIFMVKSKKNKQDSSTKDSSDDKEES